MEFRVDFSDGFQKGNRACFDSLDEVLVVDEELVQFGIEVVDESVSEFGKLPHGFFDGVWAVVVDYFVKEGIGALFVDEKPDQRVLFAELNPLYCLLSGGVECSQIVFY